MRVLQVIGLAILFAVGAALGVVLGVLIAPVSWYRGKRAVHAIGVVCRGDLTALAPGTPLAGAALVRLSGALEPMDGSSDILGIALRLQHAASDDPRVGDQDLLLGTFTSFMTAGADRKATHAGDFIANVYHSVTPWWLPGHGAVALTLTPISPAPAPAGDRLARLTAAIAADHARFTLAAQRGRAPAVPLAELRLTEVLPIDDRALRASMLRQGRGVRPLGLRNGVRLVVYPLSQLARRMRGG